MKWVAVNGKFDFSEDTIVFKGAPRPFTNDKGDEQTGLSGGLIISDQHFSSGEISAQVEFEKISKNNGCAIVFYFDPMQHWQISAGIGAPQAYIIQHYDGQWVRHAFSGTKENLTSSQSYEIKVSVRGSKVTLTIDGVDTLATVLPFPIIPSQAGLWFMDDSEIRVSNYRVANQRGHVFVVMKFCAPYTELFEVIKKVCGEFSLDACKADDTYGPGIVIADIARDIAESEFVIAEITPANPNVYYELGYAHAINKPAILLADKTIGKAPFDVAPFRIMFYENSIPGRLRFEENLRKHIEAILEKGTLIKN